MRARALEVCHIRYSLPAFLPSRGNKRGHVLADALVVPLASKQPVDNDNGVARRFSVVIVQAVDQVDSLLPACCHVKGTRSLWKQSRISQPSTQDALRRQKWRGKRPKAASRCAHCACLGFGKFLWLGIFLKIASSACASYPSKGLRRSADHGIRLAADTRSKSPPTHLPKPKCGTRYGFSAKTYSSHAMLR